MSWLRRLLGRDSREEPDEWSAGEVELSKAKPALLAALRERGARSALVGYDGGHDEGGVTSILVSRAPLEGDPAAWTEPTLPDAETIDVEAYWNADDRDSPSYRELAALYEAAEAVVCDKWGSFAGEFDVEGRLVVDVDSGRIARHDAVWVSEEDDEEDFDDDEDFDEDAWIARRRSGEPEREVEVL